MPKPSVFIGSSAEGLPVARAIKAELDHDAKCTVWNQNFFELNLSTLEGLLKGVERFDFGIFVFSPDDEITIRGENTRITRDNVIFEFGLFLGRLGRRRAFVVRSAGDLRILNDLAGVTVAHYQPVSSASELQAAVGTACDTLRNAMEAASRDSIGRMARKLSPTLLYVLRHLDRIGDARQASFFRRAFHHFLGLMGEGCARAPLLDRDGWDKAADYAFRYLEHLGMVEKANSSEYIITPRGEAVLGDEHVRARYPEAYSAQLVDLP